MKPISVLSVLCYLSLIFISQNLLGKSRDLNEFLQTIKVQKIQKEKQKVIAKKLGTQVEFRVLSFKDALNKALISSPELKLEKFVLEEMDAKIWQDGRKPNPEFFLEMENFAGSGVFQDAKKMEATAGVSVVREGGSRHLLRREATEKEKQIIQQEYVLKKADIARETGLRFIQCVCAVEMRKLSEESFKNSSEILDAVKKEVEAGRKGSSELYHAMAITSVAEAENFHSIEVMNIAFINLEEMFGGSKPSFDRLEMDWGKIEELHKTKELELSLENHQELIKLNAQEKQLETQIRVEESKGMKDISLEGGFRYDKESKDNTVTFGVSFPMMSNDRNQGGIEGVEAQIRLIQEQRKNLTSRLKNQQLKLLAHFNGAYKQSEIIRDKALPQAKKAFDLKKNGYQYGTVSLLELFNSRDILFEMQTRMIETYREVHEASWELDCFINSIK